MRSKKKLLLLSSTGGYGHIAAANTLETILSDDYDVDVVYPIKELRIWKAPNGEALYNFAITNNFTRITNFTAKCITPTIFRHRTDKMIDLIEKHIREKKPDLVISLIPYINYPVSEAARKMRIPFLLITTDNDLHNWVCDLEKRRHPQFKVTVGADLPSSKQILLSKKVLEDEIEITGLPLRLDFLQQQKTKDELRIEYGIPPTKNVVLIMMGGTGGRLSYRYVKAIIRQPLNLHCIVCAGRNLKISKRIKSIRPAEGNTVNIVPFTEKVQELFALSDLIITKPGPGTINEAIAYKLPILIDRIKPPLFWEGANVKLVEKIGIGSSIYHLKDAPEMVKKYLFDESIKRSVARAYQNIPPNQFASRIKPIIEEMTGNPAAAELLMTSRNITSSIN